MVNAMRWRDTPGSWRAAILLVGVIIAVVLVVIGMIAVPPNRSSVLVSARAVASNPPVSALPGIEPARWQVVLWRSFVDAPGTGPVSETAPSVRLFSVMRRQGRFVAALDTTGGLVYLEAGQTAGRIHVLAVDATGVDIEIGGARRRLEQGR